ncbi:ABC transporter ATP-binding protein [Halorubellus sp. JP-L1]|uniref:ABC transporter ATP-binding protein n=1 Tax=Halorubellus sp. JP-L1 TaxID=2715753 RepID=UPI00140B2E8E|nr:ABC transporter ATP-binding protein [Halorubellus sp. JP-L1]NHN43529.1 ABC transporter ATP-binding protein [Halorubellus sp. JP-L1]
MAAIELRDVTKRFGSVTALDGLDLTVEEGEVFGFLGPNGAGKSTTIDILLDYVRPSSGTARVFGHDAQEEPRFVRDRVGILPDGYGALGRMTGREQLEFTIEARRGREHPDELLERVGLAGDGDRQVRTYSKGMAQRLMLGMALVGDPDLLVLDEPTTGLDPAGARMMRETIDDAVRDGQTVFFSSHILGQVEAVADRVGILYEGRVVAVDTIDSLRETAGATGGVTVTLDDAQHDRSANVASLDDLRASVAGLDGVVDVLVDADEDGRPTVDANCTAAAKGRVVKACFDAGADVRDVDTREASLEDLFVSYTNGETPAATSTTTAGTTPAARGED